MKKHLLLSIFSVLLVVFGNPMVGVGQIAGDIAFLQYNADGTDDFAFVCLVDIPSGTVIYFTDNEPGGLTGGEGTITWTATTDVTCGTIVTITTSPTASTGSVTETNDLNFGTSGDGLWAYTGSTGSPTYIAAIGVDDPANGITTGNEGNISGTGLTLGTDAVAPAELDNVKYNGSLLTGTRAALLAAINDYNNWGGSDVSNQTFSGAFSVTDCAAPTPSNCSGAMSGTYTINASLAASCTNYQDFASAISDMVSGTRTDDNDYRHDGGISGPVVFEVATDNYLEQISIPEITGASTTNTITFRSATLSNADVFLTVASQNSSTPPNYVVELAGADHIRFEHMTLRRTGTFNYARVVEITGDASNNIFDNCYLLVEFPNGQTGDLAALVLDISSDVQTDNIIRDCWLENGSVGVKMDCNNGSDWTGFELTGNLFMDIRGDVIYLDNIDSPVITDNSIEAGSGVSGNDGIQIRYCDGNSTITGNTIEASNGTGLTQGIYLYYSPGSHSIRNNYIFGNSGTIQYGLRLNNSGASGTNGLIANNSIRIQNGSSSCGAVYLTGSEKIDVHHNTLYIAGGTGGSTYPLYTNGTSDGASLRSNVLINAANYTFGTSANHAVYITSTSGFSAGISDNAYYTSGTGAPFRGRFGSDYTDFATYITANSETGTPQNVDPVMSYVGGVGWKATAASLTNGALQIVGITTDIDGLSRYDPTTIGAHENGTGAIPPVADFEADDETPCVGQTVVFTDLSTNTPTSWAWSFSPAVTYVNSTSATSENPEVQFGAAGLYTVTLESTNADGTSVPEVKTDYIAVGLAGGTYTIGGITPDYATFNDAVADLEAFGICGPVVFDVRTGTYTEQISIDAIVGASATNTITFQSETGTNNDVVLQFASSATFSDPNYTVQLNGSDHVTFQNMTIQRTGSSTYFRVIDFSGDASYNTITGNMLTGDEAAFPSSSNSQVVYSDDANTGNTNNTISNNTIRGGYHGIFWEGTSSLTESNLTISGNDIASYYYGMEINYVDDVTISNNTISTPTQFNSTMVGIEMFRADGSLSITANTITLTGANAIKGIYLNDCEGTSGTVGDISNNMIVGGGSSTSEGINSGSGTSYKNYYYNSVYNTGTNATNASAFYLNGSSNINIRNNAFYATVGNALEILGETNVTSDYNLLHSDGDYVGSWDGNHADLASFQASNGTDANSISADPSFTSATDLHVNPGSPTDGQAVIGLGITTDIDGETRDVSTPDIGADEYESLLPIVTLSADLTTGTEAAQTVITLTATADGAVTGDQTINVTVAGTGITAGDYTLSATTITILSGQTTGTVTFTIVDDILDEGDETAEVTISHPSSGGYVIGFPSQQDILIEDNDAPTCYELMISEYHEDGNEKYVEIYNPTASAIDLTPYKLKAYFNGSGTAGSTEDLSGTLAAYATLVFKGSSSSSYTGTATSTGVCGFNGNDAIALEKSGTNIDVLGTIGNSSYWGDDLVIRRNIDVEAPNTTYTTSEWTSPGLTINISGFGSHSCDCETVDPDVNVLGNTVSIADGETATGTADHTEFLATEVGQTSTRTFTIENAGAAGTINLTNPVTISGSVFTVTTQPADVDLDAGESTTFTVTFAPTGVTTETETITIITNDPDVGEQSYTFNIAGTGSYSLASDIVSIGGETANIAHSATIVSNNVTLANSVQAGELRLRDGGGAADNDNQVTTITDLSFVVSNSANLQKVALYDGATELAEVAADVTIDFTGLSIATPTDGGFKDFSIRVTLNSAVTDNQQFQFTVISATSSAAGSGFADADAGGASTSIAGDDNRIRVTANRIAFTVEPQDGAVGAAVPSFTVSAVDAYGNIDVDATNSFTLTTSSGTDYTSGSPYTLSGGTLAITDVLYSAIKTSETLTATTTGFTGANNTAVSASFNINEFSAVNGAFLSSVVGGNYNTDGTWCECVNVGGCSGRTPGSGGWSALGATFDTPGSGDVAYVQGDVTQTGSISIGDMHILDGGMLYTTGAGTYNVSNYLKVYTDGILWTEKNFDVANGKPFIVEDDAEVYLSYTFANPTTSIWGGTEDFAANSHLYIWDWDEDLPLINDDVTNNTYSGYTAAFGNLYFDLAGGAIAGHWVLLGDDYATQNLCHDNIEFDSPNGWDIRFLASGASAAIVGVQGDFKMNSGWSSARTVALGSGTANITLNLKGDFIMDCPGDFAVRASNSPGRTVVLNIEGDLLMNGANTTTNTNFELNQNIYGTANGGTATVNLQGNLTVGADATITNSGAMADHAFNFAGTTTQLVDVASVVASSGSYGVPMYVKSGATAQLSTNNLVLDESSSLTVENGGTLDFNWAANGTTPLLVTQPASPDGTPSFAVSAGGTIKITSTNANGAITSAGNAFGNVRTTNRTYDAGATYHYIGKANQVTGDGLPTTLTNGKLIVDMNASALTLDLTASTTVGGTGELGLVNGLLVLNAEDITIGTTATVTGTPSASNMVVTNSTGEFVKTYAAATSFTYPVGDNVGTVEYSPVSLTFNSGIVGNVGVIVTDGDHPNLPTVTNYLSRYWNFTNTLGSYNYNATFMYLAADVNGTLGSIKAARYTGATTVWDAITGSNATGTALTITTAQTQATAALNQAFTGLESCDPGTWTGADDNNWNNPANWCSGVLPTLADDVVIPNVVNQPIIYNATPSVAVCNNLTLESGADLTINSGQSMVADGDVTNNGIVYVQNSGSFIQTQNGTAAHTGSGRFEVQRQAVGGYNGWSTPVVGGNLPGSNGYWYDSTEGTSDPTDDNAPDPDPGWFPHSGSMTAGQGYYSSNAGLATFSGKANNGTITKGVTEETAATPDLKGTRYNLVGNPYPSAIDADLFINNNSGVIDGSIYFWDDDNTGPGNYTLDDYATYTLAGGVPTIGGTNASGPTPTGNIASCQGFFVSCTNSGNVTFNNGQRGGSNNQFFRMAAPDAQRMWLSINNDNLELFNQTLVGFDENATDQKDWGVDAIKFRGNQNISIGAQQDNETYVIATYASIPQSGKVIPLMTYVETAATYTFVADSMEGFDNHNVYLEDLSNGSLYPLTQGSSYSFAMTSADEYNRFQLWFSPVLVTGVDEAENDFSIYATPDNMIVVETSGSEPVKGTVQITDMAGRMVLSNDINISNGIGRVQTAGLANGIYAIIFVTADGSRNTSQKVALGR